MNWWIGYSFNDLSMGKSMVKIFECVCVFQWRIIQWRFSMGKIEWHFSMAFLVDIVRLRFIQCVCFQWRIIQWENQWRIIQWGFSMVNWQCVCFAMEIFGWIFIQFLNGKN